MLRPAREEGDQRGQAGTGDGEVRFVVELKVDEIVDWLWEELKLPELKPKRAAALDEPDYVREGWDAPRIAQEFQAVSRWARRNGVRVVCNEFGVIRSRADSFSRYRWLHDVRSSLQANGLGDARVRLTVTRGVSQQDPLHGLRLAPTVLLTATPKVTG